MIVIGVDPHRSTHTATALDPATNSDVGSLRIEASITEYQRLIVWAKAWPDRAWANEDADGLGHHLALWLLALGEVVLDIPTTATARVRELSRGRRKNDRIDAAAAASVAALQGDARQVYPDTTADSLALLDERRVNLSHNRTRTVNQLHALLRELMVGGAPTSLTPLSATSALRGLRARTGPDRIRVELAKETHCRRPAFRRTPRRQRREDDRTARRARHHAARDRRHRTDPRRPSAGPHRVPEQVRLGRRLRELHWHRARPNRERRRLPAKALPLDRPVARSETPTSAAHRPVDTPGCCGRRNCKVNVDNLRRGCPDLSCERQQARGIPRNLQLDETRSRAGPQVIDWTLATAADRVAVSQLLDVAVQRDSPPIRSLSLPWNPCRSGAGPIALSA